ncbi:MAG: type II toxin-antitoxin system HicB family antitoxin [Alphaproteobacteria bacterium]|nr:type II toxin-antitoxin system HicB family antitoxin [Alphaproteobacteria bacterium]
MADLYEMVIAPLPEEEGGGYLAFYPDLHGCASDGETIEEAVANLVDARDAWIEAQKAAKRPVPKAGSMRHRVEEEDADLLKLISDQSELIEQQNETVRSLIARIEELEAKTVRSGSYAISDSWVRRSVGRQSLSKPRLVAG